MRVLFVDRVWRKHSHSADFFKDILRESGCEITDFWFEDCYRYEIPKDILDAVDVVVFWEFLYRRFSLGIAGKACVFVPMYDNDPGSRWLWRRIAYSGMTVISFCAKLTELAQSCGVKKLVDVRYAIDPDRFADYAGNPRVVALWERGQVDFSSVRALFASEDVEKVLLIRKDEEPVDSVPLSEETKTSYHVEFKSGKFLPEKEYLESLREPGVFIAPRYKEGIGLPFLEQLAMGKCVVAHNDATMNEYIEDGKTGILVDMCHPRRLTFAEVLKVRANVKALAKAAYLRWKRDRKKIMELFSNLEGIEVTKSAFGIWSMFAFVLSVIEYAWLRFLHFDDGKRRSILGFRC